MKRWSSCALALLFACGGGDSSSPDAQSPVDATSSDAPSGDATADAIVGSDAGDASIGFVHPGILLDKSQLDFVKGKIAASAQPWKGAFDQMMASGNGVGGKFSSLTYKPAPVPSVQCVGSGSNQSLNVGCTAQTDDAIAAYTQALVYYFTGNTQYADHAIAIMNAWSSTLTEIKFDATTYTNGKLQAGWTGQTITRAAEIIRYTYGGWSSADIQSFSKMLTNIFYPLVSTGWSGGGANWLMTFADATIDIGVFTDSKQMFDAGVQMWRDDVPSVIFLTTDKNPYAQLAGYPIPPKNTVYDKQTVTLQSMIDYWHDPPTPFPNGLEGETCRDMSHMVMGLDAMVMGAETAHIQGVDLYGEQQTRIVTGYEFAAKYAAQAVASTTDQKTGAVQDNVCGGSLNFGGVGYQLGWEIAYNAYANRLSVAMPSTKSFITNVTRPATYKAGLFLDWEELTFAGN
jgi:hypothetical protein